MNYIENNFTLVGINADIFELSTFYIAAPNAHLYFAGHLFAAFREFFFGEVLL